MGIAIPILALMGRDSQMPMGRDIRVHSEAVSADRQGTGLLATVRGLGIVA
jgi:hypothetical protein